MFYLLALAVWCEWGQLVLDPEVFVIEKTDDRVGTRPSYPTTNI